MPEQRDRNDVHTYAQGEEEGPTKAQGLCMILRPWRSLIAGSRCTVAQSVCCGAGPPRLPGLARLAAWRMRSGTSSRLRRAGEGAFEAGWCWEVCEAWTCQGAVRGRGGLIASLDFGFSLPVSPSSPSPPITRHLQATFCNTHRSIKPYHLCTFLDPFLPSELITSFFFSFSVCHTTPTNRPNNGLQTPL